MRLQGWKGQSLGNVLSPGGEGSGEVFSSGEHNTDLEDALAMFHNDYSSLFPSPKPGEVSLGASLCEPNVVS